ncbi:hypothetical protein OIU74_003928 [Salix koriyanagi]|uniref:Uncharacterized protein n=1 Tax=Salix koriyanagi TaxID=2511006 RepID=A0A9Q0ZLQ0_9ROSI|nr:hypothetical protein OIU74_003928 [Salix koriyanagi]
MAKQKAKKKSPSSSSRPLFHVQFVPLLRVLHPPPKNKPVTLPYPSQSRSLDFVLPPMKLTGPNQCSPPDLAAADSAIISQDLVALGAAPSLVAMGPIVVDQAPQIAPPQPPSPKLQASESSPSFSMLFASVEVHSPGDSDNDDSSAYNSDSSSHYGSPALANSELNARQPTPASSAPVDAEGPLEVPTASPSGKLGLTKSQASAASVLPTPSLAEKVVLSSEGIESVHISVALAPPLTDEGLQDPMIYEAVTGVYDWQPVPKKHTSNRQPKIGSVPADLALGKDNSTSNGISLEAVGNVSGGTDLTALGSVAAGSAMDAVFEELRAKRSHREGYAI